jgi:hypothetical protein
MPKTIVGILPEIENLGRLAAQYRDKAAACPAGTWERYNLMILAEMYTQAQADLLLNTPPQPFQLGTQC